MTKDALKRLIGDNIRKERISRNMTVDELAELLELTTGFVGLIERGRRGATIHNLYKLSEIFGIEIDRFVANKTKPSLKVSERNPVKTKRTKITSLIYQLEESELEYIIVMIKNLKILKKYNLAQFDNKDNANDTNDEPESYIQDTPRTGVTPGTKLTDEDLIKTTEKKVRKRKK